MKALSRLLREIEDLEARRREEAAEHVRAILRRVPDAEIARLVHLTMSDQVDEAVELADRWGLSNELYETAIGAPAEALSEVNHAERTDELFSEVYTRAAAIRPHIRRLEQGERKRS